MSTKIRKQIYIEPYQDQRLKRLASELNMSEAEIIRQAIDQHTSALSVLRPDLKVWEREKEFILALRKKSTIRQARSWRREDLYER